MLNDILSALYEECLLEQLSLKAFASLYSQVLVAQMSMNRRNGTEEIALALSNPEVKAAALAKYSSLLDN